MEATPREEMDSLLDMMVSFAQQRLEEVDEFYPFAGSIDSWGNLGMVGAHMGDEYPESTDVIDFLYEALAHSAASGEIRAAAIRADVRIAPSGSDEKTDAICS